MADSASLEVNLLPHSIERHLQSPLIVAGVALRIRIHRRASCLRFHVL